MTVGQATKKYSRIEIDVLLSHLLSKPKEFLFTHPEQTLTKLQEKKLAQQVKQRIKGQPIAYIVGYKEFFGLSFKVNKNVLIPRPETEWLVNQVLASPVTAKSKILDLGTGSGAIAISLYKALFPMMGTIQMVPIKKSQMGRPFVYGSDISTKALAVARQNAKDHTAQIKFIISNLFKNIIGTFDIIVANLPYVPKKIYKQNYPQLRWEPKEALVDSRKDFLIYEQFLQQAPNHINQHSTIYFEIDPFAKKLIQQWVKKYLPGWHVEFFKDFNNLWRFAKIKKAGVKLPATAIPSITKL